MTQDQVKNKKLGNFKDETNNDSGLLNPIIKQLLKDLPSVNPSELGTGKLFQKN